MERDSEDRYASKEETFVVKSRSLTKFAQIEFAILRYTETRELRPSDVGTLVGLYHFVDWGKRRSSNDGKAPSAKILARLLGIGRDTLWPSLGRLADLGIVVKTLRVGYPTTYEIADVEDWKPAGGGRKIRPGGVVGKSDQGVVGKSDQGVVGKSDQGVVGKSDHLKIESRKSRENLERKNVPGDENPVAGSAGSFKLEEEEPAIERPAKKKRKTAGEPDPRVKATIDAFDVAHKKARDGQPYVVKGGRDGAMLKRLPAEYSTAILVAMVGAYFDDDSTWWAETRSREIPSFIAWLSSPAGGEAFASAKAGRLVAKTETRDAAPSKLPPIFRTERDGTVRKYYPVGDA